MAGFAIARWGGIANSPSADSLQAGIMSDGHDYALGDDGPDGGRAMLPGHGRTRMNPLSGADGGLSGTVLYALTVSDITDIAGSDELLLVCINQPTGTIVSIHQPRPGALARAIRGTT